MMFLKSIVATGPDHNVKDLNALLDVLIKTFQFLKI